MTVDPEDAIMLQNKFIKHCQVILSMIDVLLFMSWSVGCMHYKLESIYLFKGIVLIPCFHFLAWMFVIICAHYKYTPKGITNIIYHEGISELN